MQFWMPEKLRDRLMEGSPSSECEPGNCFRYLHRDKYGRSRMPTDRLSVTIKFELPAPAVPSVRGGGCGSCGDQPDAYRAIEGYIQAGLYPCGCIGEIFIRCGIEGELVRGLLDNFATTFSIALQHGAPISVLLGKCLNSSFQPAGWTQDERHPNAKSVLDYIAGLIARFAGIERTPGEEIEPHLLVQALRADYDGGPDYRNAPASRVSEDSDKERHEGR